MEIPITPAFFNEIGIYEKLKEHEKNKEKKPIWYSESVVLMWADSKDHQQPGSFITNAHIELPLSQAVGKRVPLAHKTYALNDREHVLKSLVAHGFAEAYEVNNKLVGIRINPTGFIAGKIISKTNYLTDNIEYELWLRLWWWILRIGVIIFFTQAIKLLWDFPFRTILSNLRILSDFCSL